MKKPFQLIAVLMLCFSALLSCSSNSESATNDDASSNSNATVASNTDSGQASVEVSEDEQPNALQVAMSDENFSTLVAAIEAAGVENSVVNAGPLTIFAPLNSAFDKLPDGTVGELVKPENKSQLSLILVNHVAPANYPIDQLKKEAKKERKLYMASGSYLVVENKEGEIFVGGTKVLQSVKVSNGWVHVIDDVLIPVE